MKEIQEFFDQPGINKSGICKEAGINIRFLNMMLQGQQRMTDATKEKLFPVMQKYGFEGALAKKMGKTGVPPKPNHEDGT